MADLVKHTVFTRIPTEDTERYGTTMRALTSVLEHLKVDDGPDREADTRQSQRRVHDLIKIQALVLQHVKWERSPSSLIAN